MFVWRSDGLVSGNLGQQLGQLRRISNGIAGHLNGTYLLGLGVDAQMDLALFTLGLGAMLLALPLALRHDLLPDTDLELTLSPDWLRLRFSSRRRDSKALLFEHQRTLHELLSERLEPRREIRIAIE